MSFYCDDDAVDVFPIAFLNVFFGPGGAPSINLANICNPTDNATFPGTTLPNCSSLATDITTCQAKGKVVTLSLGGATGAVGFLSDDQATTFGQTIWDVFLGGNSSTRPFGDAVLDGIDLDIEGGGSDHYAAFVNKIHSLASGAPKKYYVTAAPQCVFPDAALKDVLNTANFDAVYVQFYNNPCGLQAFSQASSWNFGIWDNWARTMSPNKNVKIYIGAPASSTAAGSGYVPSGTLTSIAIQMRNSFPSFGGVMMWDVSQAYANNRYDLAIKTSLVAAGGTGFTFPPCDAPAFVAGTNYAAGSRVSFGGYVWQAKWFASFQPSATDANGDWNPISACAGASIPSSSTLPMTTTKPATTAIPVTPTTPSSVPSTTLITTIPIISTSNPVTSTIPPSSVPSTTATPITSNSNPFCISTAPPSSVPLTTPTNPITSTSSPVISTILPSSVPSTTPTPTPITSTSNPITSTIPPSPIPSMTPTTPGSGNCTDIASWSSSTTYQGGSQVVYNSHLWTAKWWTQADVPGGVTGVWADNGLCGSQRQVEDIPIRLKSRFFRF